jgi:hypothetical protein
MLPNLSTRLPEAERPCSALVIADSVGKADPNTHERPQCASKPTSDTALLAEIGSVGQPIISAPINQASTLAQCPLPRISALHRLALMVVSALLAALIPSVSIFAATSITLGVDARGTLPGVHRANMPRYLVQHMREVRLAGWRFEPASRGRKPLDRVEWSFKLAPYAGGEVLSFVPGRKALGVRRHVVIEAALYLDGKYQAHVAGRATIREGSPHDPNLAAAVAHLTRNLLAPKPPITPPTADSARLSRLNEGNLGTSKLPHL